MEHTASAEERNALFQQLKPCCVEISQLAIREVDNPASGSKLLTLSSQLLRILEGSTGHGPSALDEKLAEYVFFPLYHIFRQIEHYPMLLVENSLKCLTIVIVHGWKSKISAKLVQQIFSLLIFILDGVPGTTIKLDRPEETVLEAFRTQLALLDTIHASPNAAAGLEEQEYVPALGHGLTVMLNGTVDGANSSIQEAAMGCVRSLFRAIRDPATLANFLPGTMSSFSKLLSTPAHYKSASLAKGLTNVSFVLTRVLGDVRIKIISRNDDNSNITNRKDSEVLGKAWLDATVSQVRMAIIPMMKLRTHASSQVRDALNGLCISLLDECHETLQNCATFLVETGIILHEFNEEEVPLTTTLEHIVGIYPELENTVKTSIYNWMSALPQAMQASDNTLKKPLIHNVLKGMELLRKLNIHSSTIEDALPRVLRETLSSLVDKGLGQAAGPSLVPIELQDSHDLALSSEERQFAPILLSHESQRDLRTELLSLVRFLGGTSPPGSDLFSFMLESARDDASTHQLASYWLCFQLVKSGHSSTVNEDAFFDLAAFGDSQGSDVDTVFNELYTYSVQVLDEHSEFSTADWRLEAMALEVTAYAAQRARAAFRPELIDVLFPIATFLGAENTNLQHHSIMALNKIAHACDYGSVSELIIDNVDYMVNSVSLRLNTLDISPASTQVLTMMVRLAGPRLLPFLDDVVDSIFAALENYHGYPLFVESLFTVLKEIVEQATQPHALLLEDTERTTINHKRGRKKPEGLDILLEFLKRREDKRKRDKAELKNKRVLEPHPTEPWAKKENETEEDQEQGQVAGGSEEKPPASPTYQLLNRVANLTQYYLTSPTPRLRRSLLELLNTASKVLATDEDTFLPLVNAVWPVVIERIHDPEMFVAIEACYTLAGLCKTAGDFLSTRFKTEWWNGLGDWCRITKKDAVIRSGRYPTTSARKPLGIAGPSESILIIPIRTSSGVEVVADSDREPSGSLGQHASPIRVWNATVKLLTNIVSYVQVDDAMFDQILELLADVVETDEEVKAALETVNEDAVWLARYQRGKIQVIPTPSVGNFVFLHMK